MASHSPPPNESLPTRRPPPPPPAALNQREFTILPLILLCTKDPTSLQFDWPKLAERLQMKNPRSAANSWLAVRKKIEAISSSSASPGSETPPPKLTHNEQRFLANAVSFTKQPLEVDYPALALKLGMKNPRSAANAWGGIRRKIEAAGGESLSDGDKASWKISVKENNFKATAVRKSKELAKDNEQLRMQSAGPPTSGTTQPFPFKVVKRESKTLRTDEKRLVGRGYGNLDPDSDVYDMSIDQVLSKRQIHLMALAATDEAHKDQVRVKSEFFDEC